MKKSFRFLAPLITIAGTVLAVHEPAEAAVAASQALTRQVELAASQADVLEATKAQEFVLAPASESVVVAGHRSHSSHSSHGSHSSHRSSSY